MHLYNVDDIQNVYNNKHKNGPNVKVS